MNKEELKKSVEGDERITLSEGEFENVWNEQYKLVKEKLKTTDTEKLERLTLLQTNSYFNRFRNSTAKKFKGIIFSVSGVNDFGAERKYNELKEFWDGADEEIRKLAIKKGQFDEKGNPLWNQEDCPNTAFKYKDQKSGELLPLEQRRIDVEKEKLRQVFMLAKEENEEQWYPGLMTLKFKSMDLNIPKFKKVSFRANGDVREGVYRMNSTAVTNFVVNDDGVIPKEELDKLFEKYFKDVTCDLGERSIADFAGNVENVTRKIVIFKNCTVDGIGMVTKNHTLPINVVNLDSGDVEGTTFWLPSEYDLKDKVTGIEEFDENVVAFGQISVGGDKPSVNAFGFYNPKETTPEPKSEEKPETTEEQKSW